MNPGLEENLPSSTVPELLFLRILWGAFLIFQLLLGVMLWILKLPKMGPEWTATVDLSPIGLFRTLETTLQHPFNALLSSVAAGAALAGMVIPKILFNLMTEKKRPDSEATDSRGSNPKRFSRNLPYFQMRLALFLLVAAIGFIQGFARPGNPVLFIPFVLVSLSLHVSQFPRDLSLGFKRDDETAL